MSLNCHEQVKTPRHDLCTDLSLILCRDAFPLSLCQGFPVERTRWCKHVQRTSLKLSHLSALILLVSGNFCIDLGELAGPCFVILCTDGCISAIGFLSTWNCIMFVLVSFWFSMNIGVHRGSWFWYSQAFLPNKMTFGNPTSVLALICYMVRMPVSERNLSIVLGLTPNLCEQKILLEISVLKS